APRGDRPVGRRHPARLGAARRCDRLVAPPARLALAGVRRSCAMATERADVPRASLLASSLSIAVSWGRGPPASIHSVAARRCWRRGPPAQRHSIARRRCRWRAPPAQLHAFADLRSWWPTPSDWWRAPSELARLLACANRPRAALATPIANVFITAR